MPGVSAGFQSIDSETGIHLSGSGQLELFFCYFPFYEKELREELLSLAEYLLECLERRDAKVVSLGYEFYRLAGQENLSLEQILEKGREEREEEGKGELAEENGEAQEECGADWREASACGAIAETSLLDGHRSGQLLLRSTDPAYPNLTVTGDSFLIGKKKGAVDGQIKARGVSRIHGRITREGGAYYLSDLNSTNGTYLNGGRLEVNERARIRPGDQVGFADVEYQVEIL